jgi:hypothetical protein
MIHYDVVFIVSWLLTSAIILPYRFYLILVRSTFFRSKPRTWQGGMDRFVGMGFFTVLEVFLIFSLGYLSSYFLYPMVWWIFEILGFPTEIATSQTVIVIPWSIVISVTFIVVALIVRNKIRNRKK